MISLKVFTLEGIKKEDFIDVFSEYDKVVDNIPELNTDLKALVSNFYILNDVIIDDLITFEFQHDFKISDELRGQTFSYPRTYKVNVWADLSKSKQYLFVSGQKEAISFIVPIINRIIADEKFIEVKITKVNIPSEALISLSREDGVVINSSWFNKLDESLKAVYLSGHLDDEDHNIHELYEHVKNKAGDISSISFTSRKLGYNITISRKKGSLWTKSNDSTAITVIQYFEDVIKKELE